MLTNLCGRYLIHLLIVFRQLTVPQLFNNSVHHYPSVVFRKVTLSVKSHALFWRVTMNHNTHNVFRKLTARFGALKWVFGIFTVCSKTLTLVFRKLTVCFTTVILVLGKLVVCFKTPVFRELTVCLTTRIQAFTKLTVCFTHSSLVFMPNGLLYSAWGSQTYLWS
jgi:hypothetical protein